MVSKEEVLPITEQCKLLDLPRSSYYYMPEPVSDEERALMKLIDQCYLELPLYGTRRVKSWFWDNNHGLIVNPRPFTCIAHRVNDWPLAPFSYLAG